LALSALPAAAQYSVRRNGDVVQLVDAATQTTLSVLASVGNIAFEMKVKGENGFAFRTPRWKSSERWDWGICRGTTKGRFHYTGS
jgi:hypothetical protein